jgi:signal transduction histidine kinase
MAAEGKPTRIRRRTIAGLEAELARRTAERDEALAENARRTAETREAREKQAATAEILRIISGSPTDVQPTFEAIARSAAMVCGAATAVVHPFDGSLIRIGALFGIDAGAELDAVRSVFPVAPSRGTATGRAILTREVVHITDTAADPEFAHAALIRFGTALSVPMLGSGRPLGAITVTRKEIEPFSPTQIDLLRTFADQAVIAIENVRLFNELNERSGDLQVALEYQTATSDVLKVISRSTFDLAPVLEYVIETAIRLCRAHMGSIFRLEDGVYRWAVGYGLEPSYREIEMRTSIAPGTGTLVGRVALEGRTVQIADAQADPRYAVKDEARITRAHTMLGVALLREGVPIGVIAMARDRVEPFDDKEIALVTTFADQAVIAIENVRLFDELRQRTRDLEESLEQQTATAEILQVINSSPGNIAPVYDVVLEKARSLCDVPIGGLMLYDGRQFRTVALHGLPEQFLEEALRPFPPGPPHERLMRGDRLLHETNYQAVASQSGRHPASRALAEMGVRTTLVVPLRKEGSLLGFIAANRLEARPFTDKEIALLESFAAQAVIAMDNARLLDEIRQRQAELRVTFDNMGDGVAMFDAELRLAAWNRNFQEILDLPDDFLAGRPKLAEYFRYLAGRGEYASTELEGELGSHLDDPERAMRFERARPDGRVIEVRRNPVPGGGFVLIYGDVTERKRDEAAIRAARDLAENALGELRATQQQLVVQQKMAALGQLTAGIAHEIKNPLNFVNNFAGLSVELLDELKEAAAPGIAALGTEIRSAVDETIGMLTGNLAKIAEHGRRADNIVKSMLEHSRGGSGDRRNVDLNGLVDEALNLAYHGARAQDADFNVTLERDFAPALKEIDVAPQEMTRVFLNLFGNAFYATDKRARASRDASFQPVVSVRTRESGETVEVTIRDNGTGIRPDIRDQLFQPFFTTKPTGEGTGLGLSISWDIVTQQHGGTIEVESEPGAFSEFTVRLPRR